MSDLSNQILQAVDIIVNKKISDLKFDKTVEVTIKKVKDLTTGEYLAEYDGNLISVFSKDLSQTYTVGERVFIKIPEGDASKKKFIENASEEKGLSNSEIAELQTSFVGVEPSLDVLYGEHIKSNEYGVIAGNGILGDGLKSSVQIFDRTLSDNEENDISFQQYASTYNFLKISANFKTLLQDNFFEGNYGLEIVFLLDDDKTPEVKYVLDINSFDGNPYKFQIYNTQTITFSIPKGKLKGLKSIRFFENFKEYDKQKIQVFNPQTEMIEEQIKNITDKENIFIKDITIQFAEQIDSTNNLYYLQIQAPSGNIFEKNEPLTNTLTLEGRLIYKNQSILTKENSLCKWYKRDSSINIGDKLYDKDAGPGWRAINAEGYNDPEKVYFNVLEVKKENVLFENRYKLITIYNNRIILSKEASIMTKTSDFNLSIDKIIENGNQKLKLKSNKANDPNIYVGDWSVILPGGRYEKIGEKVNEIDISEYLVFSSLTFTCDIFYKLSLETNFIGPIATKEYLLTQEESDDLNSLQVTYTGPSIFKYDANGDIGIQESQLQKELKCELLNQPDFKFGIDWTIEWSIEGKVIPLEQGSPMITTNSMLTNLWVDTEGKLYYNIKEKYKNNCNNTLSIKIITLLDKKEYFFKKEIVFLKDGDQGTNGTTYLTVIKPCTIDGLEINNYSPLIYNKAWSKIRVKAFVYKDGNPIENGVTYEWDSGQEITIIGSKNTSIIEITGNSNSALNGYQYYVKLKTTILEKEESTIIYNFYPVDVIIGTLKPDTIDIKIPSYVQYDSVGEHPKFNNEGFKFKINNQDYSKSLENLDQSLEVNKRFESLNEKLVTAYYSSEEQEYKLSVTPKFLFEENLIGALKCKINNVSNDGYDTDNYIIHPIMMYLNTYGNEAINGWDGTKLDIDGKGQYILAPQVGAGIKNKDNTFTGVVMGRDTAQNKVGLYGYQNGIASFGFREDGTAFIGKSKKGQILFNKKDGNDRAIIQSGNYEVNQAGMYMDLTDGIIKMASPKDLDVTNGKIIFNTTHKRTPLSIGTDGRIKFSVDWDGTLHATGADISGKVEASDGSIGGWNITENNLSSNNGNTILNSDGSINIANGNFKVDPQGNVVLKGNITWGADSVPVKYQFSIDGISNWHSTMQPRDKYRRDSLDGGINYGAPYQFRGEDGEQGPPGSDANVPSYIKSTYIDSVRIESPTIAGNEIITTGYFKVAGDMGGLPGYIGYLGGAQGTDASGFPTFGVALSSRINSKGNIDGGNYVIITNAGARMQAGNSSIIATTNSVTMDYNNIMKIRVDSTGCHYTTSGDGGWQDIGSGGGAGDVNVIPVWG